MAVRVNIEVILSNRVLRYRADKSPRIKASGTDITAVVTASKRVFFRRQPMISVISSLLDNDRPSSPLAISPSQAK